MSFELCWPASRLDSLSQSQPLTVKKPLNRQSVSSKANTQSVSYGPLEKLTELTVEKSAQTHCPARVRCAKQRRRTRSHYWRTSVREKTPRSCCAAFAAKVQPRDPQLRVTQVHESITALSQSVSRTHLHGSYNPDIRSAPHRHAM